MLHDANDLIKLIKQAAIEAVEVSKPVAVCYGKVMSISPLKINVDQKINLGESQLILTRNVTDYKIKMSLEDDTNKKTYTVYNSLVVGDSVALLRLQGGQSYLVMDKIT